MLFLRLMRVDKPIGFLLLLYPTLAGLWIAGANQNHLTLWVVFSLGVFLTRSAGCVLNDLADKNFDKHVPRTANRDLTQGRITMRQASFVLFVLLCGCLGLLYHLPLHVFPWIFLALGLMVLYPFCKRFLIVPQLILGFAFSIGGVIAFMTVKGQGSLEAWVLFTANCFWVLAYDTQYAMVDQEADRTLGLYSSAVYFGKNALHMIRFFLICTWGLWAYLGYLLGYTTVYWASLILILLCWIHKDQLLPKSPPFEAYLSAFYSQGWIGAFWSVGLLLGRI